MRQSGLRCTVALVGGLVWLLGMPSGFADATGGAAAERTTRKLGRGLLNIASCPAELIRVPTLVGRKEGTLAACSVGVVQGAWHMLVRGLVGVYEVLTFPLPEPKGSKPLVMPEFVWAHGNWVE